MAERGIKPILNLHDKYIKMNLINPYTLGSTIPSGAIAYYTFNGDALDYSGNSRNLSTTNISYNTDRKGNASGAVECFDNTSKLDIGSTLTVGSQMSISFWVYLDVYNAPMLFFIYADTDYHTVYLAGNNINVRSGGSPTAQLIQGFTLSMSTWYHFVVIKNGNSAYAYLNNVLKGPLTCNANTAKLRYLNRKSDADATNYYLNGRMDDVRIYNRVLTADEVLSLYNEP